MPNDDYIKRSDAMRRKYTFQRCNGIEIEPIEAVPVSYLQNIPAVDVEPKQRWIPVTERLPEEKGRYLVVHGLSNGMKWVSVMYYGVPDCGEHDVCFYNATDVWGDVPCGFVTHWMPLPEPPKEEDDGD